MGDRHTAPDDWSPERCQCKECVRGRVDRDMNAAFARGILAGLEIVARISRDNKTLCQAERTNRDE
jgi:hypothetical protein